MTDLMRIILFCQIGYVAIALFFNGISWIRIQRGLSPLTATSPVKGLVSMLVVLAVILTWPLLGGWIFWLGWIFLIIRIIPGGILMHFRRLVIERNLKGYTSPLSGVVAMTINIFGIIAGVLGLFAGFPA
ncbi:MAG: hypothetical protein EP348_12815 [Alphaproteobacteria bacterium]|nr:MAG: hypothetical protein EP348_12815 [Alphaproteobacteria bacterium]